MNFLDLDKIIKEFKENRRVIKRLNPNKFQSKEEQTATGNSNFRPVYQTI